MVRGELERLIHLVAPLVKYRNSSLIRLPVELEDRRLEWEWDHNRVGVDSVSLPNKHRWAELLDRWVEPPLEEVALEWERCQLSSLVVEDFNNSSHSSSLGDLVDLSNNSNKWLLLLNRCSGEVNSQRGRG